MFGELKERTAGEARVWINQNGDRTTYAAAASRKLAADEADREWFELAKAAPSSGEIALRPRRGNTQSGG